VLKTHQMSVDESVDAMVEALREAGILKARADE
jgi:hypothetical protein